MSSIITPENKNNATVNLFARLGVDIVIGDVANKTFNDQMFEDGTLVKNTTFAQSQNGAITYDTKNNASVTLENKN